jgi:mannose/cellobiose epimerase-like protein (N-acyl-D-glucosamine 2-epimerase family)
MVDHVHGSWHRILGRRNQTIVADKGSGGKDYHVVGACFDTLAPTPPARR